MSNETGAPQGDGGQTPAAQDTPATIASTAPPKSDAEAAQRESEGKAKEQVSETGEPKQEKQEAEPEQKRNRTREYIARLSREREELRQQLQQYQQQQQQQQPPTPAAQTQRSSGDGEPKLEDYDFDVAAFQRAHSKWAVAQALKEREESTQTAEQQRKMQETAVAYYTRAAEFAEQHPDFEEVVGSIAFPLSQQLQAAIMAHEKGVEIAYHLGNNDDDAFAMASIQPHLAAAAVERLAKRIGAAQSAAAAADAAPQAVSVPTPKPISQAPPPVPRVSGRAPAEVPPEKMTDEQWYAQDRERRRKR